MADMVIILTRDAKQKKVKDLYNVIKGTRASVMILQHLDENGVIFTNHDYAVNGFKDSDIFDCGLSYLRGTLVPGCNNLPLLRFHKLFGGHYDNYWMIEDDVYFSGEWWNFFHQFDGMKDDFFTTNIRRHSEDPHWGWWGTLSHPSKHIRVEERIASFNPVYRISSRAAEFLFNAYFEGWMGHHEVLMPTLLYHAGFSISDFGGHGEFVPKGFEALFYNHNYWKEGPTNNATTFRFRPVFDIEKFYSLQLQKDKLYHPLK